jgi:ABC-type bacteriocin/lantibiotic exporter with double-glycine peptidase domain
MKNEELEQVKRVLKDNWVIIAVVSFFAAIILIAMFGFVGFMIFLLVALVALLGFIAFALYVRLSDVEDKLDQTEKSLEYVSLKTEELEDVQKQSRDESEAKAIEELTEFERLKTDPLRENAIHDQIAEMFRISQQTGASLREVARQRLEEARQHKEGSSG